METGEDTIERVTLPAESSILTDVNCDITNIEEIGCYHGEWVVTDHPSPESIVALVLHYGEDFVKPDELLDWLREHSIVSEYNEDTSCEFITDDACYGGIVALLTDFIEEKEGIRFSCEDGAISYLGIKPVVPWRQSEKIKTLSEEEFVRIMNTYLGRVLPKDAFEIGSHFPSVYDY